MSFSSIYQRYAISALGFLPAEVAESLPANWQAYQNIIDFIEASDENLSGELFRKLVDETPYDSSLLDEIPEMPEPQLFYLYTCFSMISQKYIWCCGPENAKDTLPRQIGLPFYALCKQMALPPTLTYSSLVLWNARLKNSNKSYSVDNIRLTLNIAPPKYMAALEGFGAVHASIEARGGDVMDNMLKIRDAMLEKDPHDKIETCLQNIIEDFKELRIILNHMYTYCDTDGFWGFRIYIGGTDNKLFFPNGLKIEGIEETFVSKGGSGTQSPLIQALDRFFSVKHNPLAKQYFDEMKTYMYRPHAEFLDYLSSGTQLRDYVISWNKPKLTKLYDQAVGEFANYRRLHYKLIHDYIVHNIKKDQQAKELEPDKKNIFESKGTGGTDPHVFLMDVIDRTLRSKVQGSKFNDLEETKNGDTVSEMKKNPEIELVKSSSVSEFIKTKISGSEQSAKQTLWWPWRASIILLFVLLCLPLLNKLFA